MGDFWSGETDYDRNAGARAKEAKAAQEIIRQKNQAALDNIFTSGQTSFGMNGSNAENAGRIEGLQRAKILTGKNPYQIGEDNQEAFSNIKKRTTLSDTGSELLRANKAGAVADARNQMQSQGVKGGAALGAVSQVERAKSYDVNNQLVDSQRKAEQDYMNASKANANFTNEMEMGYGAMASGKDFQAPANNSGGFGTVICTELYRQKIFTLEIMAKDFDYGVKILAEKPHVYWGYRSWADKVVPLMQKSKKVTKIVAFFALPWAHNMAGEKNLFGKIISLVGEFVCGLIGRMLENKSGEKYVQN